MTEDLEAQTSPNAEAMRSELLGSVEELLSVINAVGSGELSRRLEVRYDESHPVGALTRSINAMIDALQEARTQSAAYSQKLTEQISTIQVQQAAIEELSTPIIEIWTGVLCCPIIGVLDSARATEMTGTLLNAIVEKKAPRAIIDITGIEVMDTHTADHFIRMARSVRLLGARCVLSGVRPNIARMIVQMGIDLSGIDSYRTMREALRNYVRSMAESTKAAPGNEVTRK